MQSHLLLVCHPLLVLCFRTSYTISPSRWSYVKCLPRGFHTCPQFQETNNGHLHNYAWMLQLQSNVGTKSSPWPVNNNKNIRVTITCGTFRTDLDVNDSKDANATAASSRSHLTWHEAKALVWALCVPTLSCPQETRWDGAPQPPRLRQALLLSWETQLL